VRRGGAAPHRATNGTMIVLYGPSSVPYTEKVRRALLLKGLAFQVREPQSPEDYKRWSPRTGLLPVLEIDGQRIADSTEILLALDERWPRPPLLAAEPKTAAQQRQLEDWADESLAWYFRRWLALRDEQAAGRLPDPGRAPSGRLLRLAAWLRAGGTWERPETGLLRGVAARLDDLGNFLGARPFFYAYEISMADLSVYGLVFSLLRDVIPGSARLIAERPLLLDFMRRVESVTEAGTALRDREPELTRTRAEGI
jgi:glutathione S-transferase